MSYKKFSSAQDDSSDNKPDDKSKPASTADQTATQTEKAPAEVAPVRKS